MSRFVFEGRTAVITGAASGIGEALAEALAARGAHLALADINAARMAEVAQRLEAPGRRVTATALDVTDRAAVNEFAEEVRRQHGAAHLVFNNAGVALGGTFDQVSADDFDWLMKINFHGVVDMTRAFLPLLREADEARLVNISSLFGLVAPPGQTAYSAAKFAVRGFSAALRHELLGTPIGVTTVHPGGVNTRIAEDARMADAATPEQIEAGQARLKRMLVMPPPEAARIILRGVERRKTRVLVGRDAHTMAVLERLWPARYWSLVSRALGVKPGATH